MNSSNFNRRNKSKESFVTGGIEIEDIHKHSTQATTEDEGVRMQVILTKSQRAWLKRKAYEEDTQMSKILRRLVDGAIREEG